MGAKVYSIKEHGFVEVPLSDLLDGNKLRVDPTVERKGYFTLQPRKDRLQLQARGYVGVIPINDRVAIDVRPRVAVSNFLRLLEVAEYAPSVLAASSRGYALDEQWSDSLLDLYGRALVDQLEVVQSKGLLRGYEGHEAVTSFPRGRVLMGRTAELAALGKRHVAVARWFERTADTPVNRCLKYAVWFLGQRYARVSPPGAEARRLRKSLSAGFASLSGVQLDRKRSFLKDPIVLSTHRVPAPRAYYRQALDLALAIIQTHAVRVDRPGSAVSLPSLTLRMEDVFEMYLRNVLKRVSRREQWPWEVLDGRQKPPAGALKPLLDTEPSPRATPDIVFRDSGDPLVLEVKYKPAGDWPDRVDLNQAIVYGASYKSQHVVLVQPRKDEEAEKGLRPLGMMGEMGVYQYVFDLGASDLRAEEESFGQAMKALAVPRT